MNDLTPLLPSQDLICTRRSRDAKRLTNAKKLHPGLRADRVFAARAVFLNFRSSCPDQIEADPHDVLDAYVGRVKNEVLALEAKTTKLSRERHKNGQSIRLALSFLRKFGRFAVQDYSELPQSTRAAIIELLKW